MSFTCLFRLDLQAMEILVAKAALIFIAANCCWFGKLSQLLHKHAMSLPLKGKEGRRTRPASACMEPTAAKFASRSNEWHRRTIGYPVSDRGFTNFVETKKFGGRHCGHWQAQLTKICTSLVVLQLCQGEFIDSITTVCQCLHNATTFND